MLLGVPKFYVVELCVQENSSTSSRSFNTGQTMAYSFIFVAKTTQVKLFINRFTERTYQV